MTSASNPEKNWLVKSSTRILGPYSLEELTEQLKTKQISIIDEVRQPHTRWAYIRENHTFMELVRAIRDERDPHSEDTMTHSIAQNTMTKTDAIVVHDDLTPTPYPFNTDITPPPERPAPPGMKDVTPSVEKIIPRTPAGMPGKVYGSSQDAGMQERLKNQSNSMRWALIGIAVLIAVGVIFLASRKDQKRGGSYDELISQAVRYKNLGLYEKSLQSYQRASKIKEPDADTAIQMAPVLITEDRQTILGRRILEGTLGKEGRGRDQIVEALLGIAVSYMMDGDLKQAEDTLQKAIGHEPFNMSALMNLAIIQLKKGNYQQAMRDFEAIFKRNPQSALALFGRSIATTEYARKAQDLNPLPLLARDIRTMVQRTGFLRQELMMFLIYAQSMMGDVDGVNQGVVQFLNQPSNQARDYVRPLTIEWRFTQWDYIEKFCSDLFQKYASNPEVKAVRAVCLMEVNRDSDAAKLLQEAMAEAPRDPYVLATQAEYLLKIGRSPEARSLLKMPEVSNLMLKHLLMGKTCIEAQDPPCALTAFGVAYQKDPQSGIAAYGLAWAKLKNKERTAAYDYVRMGLQGEPNYIPLLEMRDQLEYE